MACCDKGMDAMAIPALRSRFGQANETSTRKEEGQGAGADRVLRALQNVSEHCISLQPERRAPLLCRIGRTSARQLRLRALKLVLDEGVDDGHARDGCQLLMFALAPTRWVDGFTPASGS